MGIMKKGFLILSGVLYILFIIETLTGYWIWKPRVVGEIFNYLLTRGDAYYYHVKLLPIPLLFLFFLHVSIALKKYMRRNQKLYMSVIAANVILFLFFFYLHIV